MKIVVCMKRVLDSAKIQIDPVKHTMIREGVPSIINPDDKAAIEVALQIKDKIPGSTVTIVTMAREDSDPAIREALAMGVDHAYLLSDAAFGGADTWATSCTVVAGLKKLEYDLVLCGRQSIIGDTAQTGSQIGEKLGLPQVSYVDEIKEVTEDSVTVCRQFEDRHHVCRVKLPCLLTVMSEIAEPRYMTVQGIIDAYNDADRMTVWHLDDLSEFLTEDDAGLKGSPTIVASSKTKEVGQLGEIVTPANAGEAAKLIVDRLVEKHYL